MAVIHIVGWNESPEELSVALKKGLDVESVEKSGKNLKVVFREKKRTNRCINKQDILELRNMGHSYSSIAKQMGCSKTYAIKVCKAAETL